MSTPGLSKEQQRNELDAIRNIFDNDFKIAKTKALRTGSPQDIETVLKLKGIFPDFSKLVRWYFC